jgi:WhiB family redox-sensing transcriptional regulator
VGWGVAVTARRNPESVPRAGSGGTLMLPVLPGGLALPSLPGALCKGADPGVWFPSATGWLAGRADAAAKAVCARCPVRVRCLEWALAANEPEGVWGGATPQERAEIRRERRAGGR